VNGERDGAPRAAVEPLLLPDALLFQLALRGVVRLQDLAAAAGVPDDEAAASVAVLEEQGLVLRRPRGADEHVSPTPPGRERAAEVIAAEGAALRAAVAEVDAGFAGLNRRVKQILLRWQVRTDRPTQVPNDHSDARYDRQVLSELREVHRAADDLLARLEPLRARYGSLRRRLRDALARALAGDVRAVAGVTGDSFHTAWWELHGDLLAILGRARGEADV
jgi:DNA-binding MarR family transcriptional regulator